MGEALQHLVLVRHGESEGDVRRAAWRRGEMVRAAKMPEEEEITALGVRQCHQAGQWIAKHILQRYSLPGFDGYFVSSALRSLQSAVAMDLDGAVWQTDERLDERNRGHIRGLLPAEHKYYFPESFEQMKTDPLHWSPPGGETMMEVVDKCTEIYECISNLRSVIIVAHRDTTWAFKSFIEHLNDIEMAAVDTEIIGNACTLHYTSINPKTSQQLSELTWSYFINPTMPETATGWQMLPNATSYTA